MRTKYTKELFIERLTKESKHRNDLLEFRNRIFLPTLQKFDGKVYNIRFIKALREANEDELIYVRELENEHIIVEKRFERYRYTDNEQIYLKVVLRDGRIDAAASVTDDMGKKWVENFKLHTDELLAVIENYELYIAKCEELQTHINEFANISYKFRENITFSNAFLVK